jgi:outer membrane protein OmpA-like peptidoglycan-associated protein
MPPTTAGPIIRAGSLAILALACRGAEVPARDDSPAQSERSRPAEPESRTLVTGQPCDPVAGAEAEITEQEAATIPMVAGLTLGYVWVGPDSGTTDFDHECLTQVTAVEAARVVFMSRCADPRDSSGVRRRTQLCRGDLRDGSIYRTEFGARIPDLVAGSTMSVLSRRAFRELRDGGETRFRQVHLLASSWQPGTEAPDPDATVYVQEDVSGMLRRTGNGTVPVQLNDSLVELPVIRAEVVLRDAEGNLPEQRERLTVLDDERLPVVLDNQRESTASGIRFIRVTWPRRTTLERELAEDRASVVYGIFFDYNSAAIRDESEAVLGEIAAVLRTHADWTLRIEGHTDSIGGDAFNRDLSLRRAEAVRAALVERYAIVADRLTTSGAGASRPVETNDTPEGRARNRRVELTRP